MFKSLPPKVKIVEVGPRDGLQNEKEILPLEDKLEYIKLLSKTGLQTIEITSFVSPKAIPQMGDAERLYKAASSALVSSINKPCLVPNMKGLESALSAGVSEISLFSATSDSFTSKNINCSVDESFERMRDVAKVANEKKLKTRGYVSTAFGCPYEGEVSLDKLVEVIKRFFDLGVYEVSVGDTIGVATPSQVDQILKKLSSEFDKNKLAMHFHDTRGMAVTNVLVSLENGFSIFDASSGGLGGCPYAKGASGNVGTEDLIYLFDSLGIEHGVDLNKLVDASRFILGRLNKSTTSKFLKALLAKDQ